MRPKDLAELLRHLRERAGMSQEGLADESGVPRSVIGQWEQGRNLATVARYMSTIEAMGYKIPAPKADW